MELGNKAINLFKSYLSNRTQVVEINSCYSSTMKIEKGVPQGSILAPCLFRIYINDLALIKLSGSIQLFADDALITYTANSIDSLHMQMQSDLLAIKLWLNLNQLILNVKKTKYMIFENRSFDINIFNVRPLVYNDFVIERVSNFKYLGLLIDNKLTWSNHVDNIKKRILPYIFAINRIKGTVNKRSLLLMYNAYIESRLLYLSPIWSGCASFRIHELEILQKRVFKYILKVPRRFPSSELFKEFSSLSLLLKRELLVLIYKIVNNEIKHTFELNQVNSRHNYPTRRRSNYLIEFFGSSAAKNNILYRGLSIFNGLPSDIKNSQTLKVFKYNLQSYLKNNV